MNLFKQIGAVTGLGLRTLSSRRGTSLVVVIGMACAAGALVSILSLSIGFMKTATANGRTDRAIVLTRNSQFEGSGSISRANAATISDAPGVARDSDGKPVVSAEEFVYTLATKKGDGMDSYISVRGVGPKNLALRPEIHLVSGRMFQPGKYELVVGKALQDAFVGLTDGSRIALPDGDWTITGTFTSGGDSHESELFTDAATLMAASRDTSFKSVWVKLESAAAFDRFKNAMTSNPTLTVDVSRETDYNAKNSQQLNLILKVVAYVVGGIMGLGALFGALNTMYSSISSRTVEIATLRAIGFGGSAVLVSVLAESLLLAGAGALLGAGVAWAAFNGNGHVFGGTAFHLVVTPDIILGSVIFACILGFVGGIFPAAKAARRPVVDALRAR
jgi:putative ABC transport system permease protein